MATRAELNRDLDAVIASRVARRAVEQVTDQVQAAARAAAPAGKVWVTSHDERVRPSHADTDGQLIPANLRYKLPAVHHVRGVGPQIVPGRFDLGREPRDPALPIGQRANCRCDSVEIPGAVARSIQATATTVTGTRVSAQVYTQFHRAAESEFGTSEDSAARFMRAGARAGAARLRR